MNAIEAAVASWEADPSMQGLDPRRLKPGEVIRLLNSTDQGPVIKAAQLARHRGEAGFRIGDGRTIDFFRYVAWLFDRRHAPQPPPHNAGAPPHSAGLTKQARYSRSEAAKGADIGPIRPVQNPERKQACRFDLELYLTTYFPGTSGKNPLSDDHRRVIKRMQGVLLEGGREAKAIYRGFAKSTLAENASIWATSYGHRKFIPLFGATRTAAGDSMESIKSELETNDLLDEDFPEITQAIRALEGKVQRCASQTAGGGETRQGQRTHIEWTARKIVLPTIEGSPASGAVITCNGITAATRGLKHKRPDGTNQRPDAVLIDDPQTDESAAKPSSVNKRLGIIRKVILRLAGHQKQIACMVNGTVIEKDDVIDQLTDPKRNPSFQSERIKMVRKWAAAHETLWLDQYARIRNTYDPEDPDDQARAHREATEFYRTRRAEMDAGAEVSWEYCLDEGCELSALQHAYNILIDDGPNVFASECQQEPVASAEEELAPSLRGIDEKLNRLERGLAPIWATHLVAFADVQGKALYYVVMAFADNFTGAVIDYGTWPEQARAYFILREVSRTLEMELAASGKTGGEEAAIWHGLDQLTARLLPRAWKREDKTELRIERCLVDSGYQTDTVYEFCRRSPFGAVLMPSKGQGIPAGKTPMTEWQIKPHERPGFHFVVTTDPTRRAVRLLKFDTYFWKTFVAGRLKALGPGALSVFGDRAELHRMLGDHFKAEFAKKTADPGKTSGTWRVVWRWDQKPGEDNHLLDGVVGCYAAAALQGCRLGENRPKDQARKNDPPDYMIAGRAR